MNALAAAPTMARTTSRFGFARSNGVVSAPLRSKLANNKASSSISFTVNAKAAPVKGTKVIVQGVNGMDMTDSIKEYAEKKISKAVDHFDQHDVREVDVRCSSRGGEEQLGGTVQKTEVTVYTKRGIIRAEEEGENLFASIDAASNIIERKFRKMKEKKSNKRPAHNKNSPKETTAAIAEAAAMADDASMDEEDAPDAA